MYSHKSISTESSIWRNFAHLDHWSKYARVIDPYETKRACYRHKQQNIIF